MSLDPNTTVRVELSTAKATDSRVAPQITLRVEDGASGETLVHAEFDAAAWWHIMTGSLRTVPAFTTPHPERLGRTMRTDSFHVERRDVGYNATDEEATELLTGRAREMFPDAETISVRRTNSGWKVVCHSWPEDNA